MSLEPTNSVTAPPLGVIAALGAPEIVLIVVLIVAFAGGIAAFVSHRKRAMGVELSPKATATLATDVIEPDESELVSVDGPEGDVVVEERPEVDLAPPVRPSFFDRLGRARSAFTGYLGDLVGLDKIGEDTWEDLEEALIRADVGVQTSLGLIADVRSDAKESGSEDGASVMLLLKERMKAELAGKDRSLNVDEGKTNVWLFVGVNGVGKTTTIGKLGKRLALEEHKVMMAAGDTFRAAAAEQLTMWAERSGAEIVRGNEGSDPSSVIFDGVSAAEARGCDVVLADTAGRLQNKTNLMEELTKVRRVAAKPPGHVSEVLLVLDATTGQNGMNQAKVFAEAVEVTGVVLTKLDGSAKGGIVFAVESDLGLPVKLVGLGEGVDDLVDFDSDAFVEALFS